jgi:hypothetical protein
MKKVFGFILKRRVFSQVTELCPFSLVKYGFCANSRKLRAEELETIEFFAKHLMQQN